MNGSVEMTSRDDSNTSKGKTWSGDTIMQIGETSKGKTRSGDTIMEIGETSKGKTKSGDTILNEAQCYIHKVPVKFRSEYDKDTYEPRIVSIGPYHHNIKSLKINAEHKKRYLQDLISRDKKKKTSKSVFSRAIEEVAEDARACYAEPIDSNIDFVEMMVLDGCFILELLFKFSEKNDQQTNKKKTQNDPIFHTNKKKTQNDPIFDTTWMVYILRRDLVLLENQLPLIVLQKLFQLSNYPNPEQYTLGGFVTTFFNVILPTAIPAPENFTAEGHHILDLLRNYLLPNKPKKPNSDSDGALPNNFYWDFAHNATDLWESGVSIKEKKLSEYGLLDITFTEHGRPFWPKMGVLEIPKFYFGESWRILMPNLIALEQCRSDYEDEITSYVILMDSLIDSSNDVKILRDNGILDGLFHEDEKVAKDINNLVKGNIVDKFCYNDLSIRVNKYCRRSYNKRRATCYHDYFDTPCKAISFFAALVLLALTVLQTIFTIFPYYQPRK